MLPWLILAAAILLGLYIMAGGDFFAGLETGQLAYLVVATLLVSLYVLSIALDYRGRKLTAMRHAIIWIGLFLAVVTGYAYREELKVAAARVSGELSPAGSVLDVSTSESGERSVRLRRRANGGFVARGSVNGADMTLLVDTGATTVVLKPADAERAGIDLSTLAYTMPVDTANGTTFAAPTRLKSLAIGPIEVRDIEALVAAPGNLKESLLGMSFLKRLRSYEFSGDFLTLRG